MVLALIAWLSKLIKGKQPSLPGSLDKPFLHVWHKPIWSDRWILFRQCQWDLLASRYSSIVQSIIVFSRNHDQHIRAAYQSVVGFFWFLDIAKCLTIRMPR
jgi:hypothetical protein